MVVGCLLFVLAVFVVVIGTKEDEAIVLYYDADFEEVKEDSEVGAEDEVGFVVEEVADVASHDSGRAVSGHQDSGSHRGPDSRSAINIAKSSPQSVEELQQLVAEKDPVQMNVRAQARVQAQQIYEAMKRDSK